MNFFLNFSTKSPAQGSIPAQNIYLFACDPQIIIVCLGVTLCHCDIFLSP